MMTATIDGILVLVALLVTAVVVLAAIGLWIELDRPPEVEDWEMELRDDG